MYKILVVLFVAFIAFSCNTQVKTPGFAIVVDTDSYKQAKSEIEAYAKAVENDGLRTFIIEDIWGNPDSIKAELIKLYKHSTNPIEGAVFIGDIPIAMVRDAQHLTTAFKMDQIRFPFYRSSIPSDRFYDDFDLEFEYLENDTVNTLLHYYSLKATSTQRLLPEIYTARIKPFNTEHKYNDLKKYLNKVVRLKAQQNEADKLLFFAGHGYNSESMIARMDEKTTLLSQFPNTNVQKNSVEYIDHSMDVHIKDRLISELQRNDLDIAMLHHHGGDDAQYLNGMPKVDGVTFQIRGIKYYLRSKLRSAKRRGADIQKTKQDYMDRLGVPASWFEGSFDKDIIEEDSLFNSNLDIVISDALEIKPNARVIILDACFNGSFQLDEYIAGTYIFNDGNTIAVQANSVNSLQDKWPEEFLGLLGLGLRVGNWSSHICYLEGHMFGDPTFHFNSYDNSLDVNQAMANTDNKFWLEMLNSKHADVQSMALRKLHVNKYSDVSNLLLSTFKSSSYNSVRAECLRMLTAHNDENFIECLKLAVDDSYEFVRRQAVYLIGKSGDPRLVKSILKVALKNNSSARVEFNIKSAVGFFDTELLKDNFDEVFSTCSFNNPDEVKDVVLQALSKSNSRMKSNTEDIFSEESSIKNVASGVRALRNSNYHLDVEQFCEFMLNKDNDESNRLKMVEALGWFNISYKKPLIVDACNKIIADTEETEIIINEAIKTKNRLTEEWYR